MRIEIIFAGFFILCTAASCVSKPGRPDSALCTVTEEGGDCTNRIGDFKEPHHRLLCTNLEGYAMLEDYVDALELEVRRLRRECRR
jgi:hypothetical protein